MISSGTVNHTSHIHPHSTGSQASQVSSTETYTNRQQDVTRKEEFDREEEHRLR